MFKYTWQTILGLFSVNLIIAIWTAYRLDVYACIASIWILLSILLGRQVKPTLEIILIIALLVIHPIALAGGLAWARMKEREGRIRLEEEAEGGGVFVEGRE